MRHSIEVGGLHVVTDHKAVEESLTGEDLVATIGKVVQGGASVVQLRYKGVTSKQVIALGEHLIPHIRGKAALIVNDKIDVALALGADGVHVGQEDVSVTEARKLIGDRILGVSAYSPELAKKAQKDGADYIGVLVFTSQSTKPRAGSGVGIEGLREIADAVTIPVIGIGGINKNNAANVLFEGGAQGIAVVGSVLRDRDPRRAATELSAIIDYNRRN